MDYRESKHVMCFLKNLGKLFGNVKTHIRIIEPLPNISRVFSLIFSTRKIVK